MDCKICLGKCTDCNGVNVEPIEGTTEYKCNQTGKVLVYRDQMLVEYNMVDVYLGKEREIFFRPGYIFTGSELIKGLPDNNIVNDDNETIEQIALYRIITVKGVNITVERCYLSSQAHELVSDFAGSLVQLSD
jgi:hypothetical protein